MFVLRKNKVILNLCACRLESISFKNYSRKFNDPGIGKRAKLMEEIEDFDPESLDYEANFEHINYSHKEYMLEMEKFKEKLKYDIVKQKYFKTKYPNFLTWHDKEQIKLLHRQDPEEWNVLKLSEGFPALPDVIQKIIKSNWRKDDVSKIKAHDVSVQENWKKFKNNELKDLPEGLANHLRKFSDRKLNFHSYEKMENENKIQLTIKQKPGEFSEIISSFEELRNKKIEDGNVQNVKVDLRSEDYPPTNNGDNDTYLSGKLMNKRAVTLDTLKCKVEKKLQEGKYVSLEDEAIVKMSKTTENSLEKQPISKDEFSLTKYNTGQIMLVDEKKEQDYNHLIYPEKISIPRKILKQGCTYKLNDCFYGSDGEFLYRVPGMTD